MHMIFDFDSTKKLRTYSVLYNEFVGDSNSGFFFIFRNCRFSTVPDHEARIGARLVR
jgi:hypothetical protein